MPPKREYDSSDDTTPTSTPTKKLKSPNAKSPSKWSQSEERKFREGIDKIVKAGLWAELKNDPELARRGCNGVTQHWKALYKKI